MNKTSIGVILFIIGIMLIYTGFTGRTISTVAGLIHGGEVLVDA